jgi:hypothetical protein
VNIKNYTSDVPAGTTINRIQNLLIEAKVNGITMEYGPNGEIVALLFHVNLDARRYSIRLTANVDGVHDTLWKDYVGNDRLYSDGQGVANGRKRKLKKEFRQQAERTAWKLQQDWVQVQLSLLQLQKVDFLQVFMAYLWDGQQTFYQRAIAAGGILALPAASGSD